MGCIACCVDTNTYNLLSGSPQPPVFTLRETEYNIFETCGSLSAAGSIFTLSQFFLLEVKLESCKNSIDKNKEINIRMRDRCSDIDFYHRFSFFPLPLYNYAQ